MALGVGEGMAAREPWGTNMIGRSPQGWSELSQSTQTLLAVRFLAFVVIKRQSRHGGGSNPLPALEHKACAGIAEQVITQTVPCSDEVINDPIICAL